MFSGFKKRGIRKGNTMGITLKCKKTGTDYDMGYFDFMRLREKVAELCSEEFGKHYKKLFYAPAIGEARAEFFQEFDKKTQELLDAKAVHIKIADFCLQSDCNGKIQYGACKEIYKHVKDYDDDYCYGYSASPNAMTFKDFKHLLLECIENKSQLVWN